MAREWNGTTDYIHYGSAAVLDDLLVGGAISFHTRLYVQTAGEAGSGRAVSKRSLDAAGGWSIHPWTTQTVRAFSLTTGTIMDSRSVNNALTLNAWHSLVVTYDDAGDRQGHIYVDGAEVSYTLQQAATGTTRTEADGQFYLGSNWEFNRTFDGEQCEVALWTRVITADEIMALSRGFAPLFFLSGMVLYAPLVRDTLDLKGNPATVNGTTVTTHPRVLRPIAPQIASLLTAVPYAPELFGDHPSEAPLRADGSGGAPTHVAPVNTLYMDEVANKLYVSKGGGTWVGVSLT